MRLCKNNAIELVRRSYFILNYNTFGLDRGVPTGDIPPQNVGAYGDYRFIFSQHICEFAHILLILCIINVYFLYTLTILCTYTVRFIRANVPARRVVVYIYSLHIIYIIYKQKTCKSARRCISIHRSGVLYIIYIL